MARGRSTKVLFVHSVLTSRFNPASFKLGRVVVLQLKGASMGHTLCTSRRRLSYRVGVPQCEISSILQGWCPSMRNFKSWSHGAKLVHLSALPTLGPHISPQHCARHLGKVVVLQSKGASELATRGPHSVESTSGVPRS